MKLALTIAIALLAILAAGLFYYVHEPVQRSGSVQLSIVVLGTPVSNQTVPASQLLAGHNVTTTLAPKALKCVDGVCANQDYYWKAYVNGKYQSLGIDQLSLKDGDNVELRYE
ncbi:MAG: DUF4430 domain-containing protein [Nanoarchaeota archaeon]